MDPLIQLKAKPPLFFITLVIACIQLSPSARAVVPAPDGGYPNFNTAEGQNALLSLTSGGYNTAVGFFSLRNDKTGQLNTAIGAGALFANTADLNTATGAAALLSNTIGTNNTAYGAFALFHNITGGGHTAVGYNALATAAAGSSAFAANTAVGVNALFNDTTGNGNTAVGAGALFNTTGGNNTAFGNFAGSVLTTGDNNIDIGNVGAAGESNTIRIGTQGTQTFTIVAGISNDIQAFGTPVIVTTDGYLGVQTSSARFKDEIKPMNAASKPLFALRPVIFHYKKGIDPKGIPQFGLVAEDVERVNPDLVVRDKDGKPYTVRYDQVNAMLLNEFLKEHRAFLEEQGKVERLEKQVAALTTGLEKVSAQLELNNSASQTVVGNR
jgi:hypothetical protein